LHPRKTNRQAPEAARTEAEGSLEEKLDSGGREERRHEATLVVQLAAS
jgi:hypothetical protein